MTYAATRAEGATFGDKPTFQSDDNFTFALSDDKKAFTIAFNGLETTVGTGTLPAAIAGRMRSQRSDAPVTTRVFSLVLPVTGGKPVKTALFASGFALTDQGASATLLFNVNGQYTAVAFPPGSDGEFVQELDYAADAAPEIRLTVFLLAEHESGNPNAAEIGRAHV